MSYDIEGTVAPGFEAAKEAFAVNFARVGDYQEVGASFAAFHRGRCVVDLWGGFTDGARTQSLDTRHAGQCLVEHEGDHSGGRGTARRSRASALRRQGRVRVAGIREQRQSRCDRRARALASGGTAGLHRTDQRHRSMRLRWLRRQARAAEAGLGAGHGDLLSRDDLWLARRRDRAARGRQNRSDGSSRRKSQSRSMRTFSSACRRTRTRARRRCCRPRAPRCRRRFPMSP